MNNDLLARILNGEAAPDEISEFLTAAKNDAGLRARYVELAELEGLLGIALESEHARARHRIRILEAVKNADQRNFAGVVTHRLRKRRAFQQWVAIAAVFTLLLVGWAIVGREKPAAATVMRTESVTWGAAKALASGDDLGIGGTLEFSAGLVELQISDQGKMVVEGPARLEFPGTRHSVLRRGRVVMKVSPAGHGYLIETPEGNIVDLGTEFGVSVGSDGESEIQVIEGEVEATPQRGATVLLKRDEAFQLAEGGQRISADQGKFYTALPPRRQPSANFVRWPLDEKTGDVAATIERGIPSSGHKDLKLIGMDDGSVPLWSPGVFGNGLKFDGKGGFAESAFRGIGGAQPRTVCFWVKVPRDFSQREGFAIVSWGRFEGDRPGQSWQIAINPIQEDGPIGRIRLGTHLGQIVGSTDLRDGEWHHVAAVLYGGTHPNIGTHVMVYVDGELEPIFRRSLREIRTEIDAADHGVWLGRNITYSGVNIRNHAHGGFFRGEVDEVYIFDGALTQKNIRRLKDANALPE